MNDLSSINLSLGPKDLVEFIKTLVRAKQPGFIWGPPGVAKSALMRVVAKDLDMQLYDFRALMRDPVDLNGIPNASHDKRHTEWLRPGFLPELTEYNSEERGIFFIDELPAASQAMQATCYQIVHDKMAGEHKMHPGWVPMGAGNGSEHGAVYNAMPTPLKTRFIHANIMLEQEKDGFKRLVNQSQWLEDWIEWGLGDGQIHPSVIAYHRFTSGVDLYAFSKNTQTFPCLRTWEYVSNVLKTNPSPSVLLPLLSGAIGSGFAYKAYAFFIDAMTLITPEMILKEPTKVTVPKIVSQKYAVVGALASYLVQLQDEKEFSQTFEQAMKFVDRLDNEFQCIFVEDVYNGRRGKGDMGQVPAYVKWVFGPVGALHLKANQLV